MLNEMMHRPIVKEEVVAFMRSRQKQLTGELKNLEEVAHKRGIPVIPHETVVFLQFLLKQLKPKNILEVGCAIGFSASLMAQYVGDEGHVTTIDRYEKMIAEAKINFAAQHLEDKVTLLEGDGAEILPTLTETYDFIFMDSAKSKYIEFLPELLRVLDKDGVIMIDDVMQAGTILQPIEEIPRKNRAIYRKLNLLMDTVLDHPDLTVSLVPLGDGVLLISKNKADVIL